MGHPVNERARQTSGIPANVELHHGVVAPNLKYPPWSMTDIEEFWEVRWMPDSNQSTIT
jgi:hypothetical protein